MARKQTKSDPIIQPSIRSNGEKHILEELFDGDQDDLPILKSVGYAQAKPGSNQWIAYTLTTKGKEIISIQCEEPNLRAIAEESAKIAFVTAFIDSEF